MNLRDNHPQITTLPHEASRWTDEKAEDVALLWNLLVPPGTCLEAEAQLDGCEEDALSRVAVHHVHTIDDNRRVLTRIGWLVSREDQCYG